MLILLKIMPFLLNSIATNEYVKFVLELIEIVKILFAPVVSVNTVLRLKKLIELHLKQFKRLFPDKNIIPKQHYMLHLPAQILSLESQSTVFSNSGPLNLTTKMSVNHL